MSNARNFKSITPAEPTEAEIEAFAERRGIPVLKTVEVPAPAVPTETEAAPLAPSTRIAVDMPIYLADQLKLRALKERCSTRFLILKAIRSAGFDINEQDLVADGRRIRS